MNYTVKFEKHPEFLQATVIGRNEANVVSAYLSEILAECKKLQCFRILIDERLDGARLDAGDIFDIASEGAQKALGVFQAVAYVEQNMGDMAEFAETVAINRGMPVRAFTSVQDAERWLVAQVEGEDEQFIFSEGDSSRQGQ